MRECPYCVEPVEADASKCPHCGEFLDERRSSAKQRPTAVTVFAVLNGVAGALCLGLMLLQTLNMVMVMGAIGPNVGFLVSVAVGMGLYAVAGGSLIAMALGLWQLKPWARSVSIGCSGLAAALFLLLIGVGVFTFATDNSSDGPIVLAFAGGIGVVGLAFWVTQLVFMMQPKIAAAFSPH